MNGMNLITSTFIDYIKCTLKYARLQGHNCNYLGENGREESFSCLQIEMFAYPTTPSPKL